MPLNPDDVVKKQFGSTQFRRGYDEAEVDDFLDEVVADLRRLNGENDELRSQLEECRRSKSAGRSAGAGSKSTDSSAAKTPEAAEPDPELKAAADRDHAELAKALADIESLRTQHAEELSEAQAKSQADLAALKSEHETQLAAASGAAREQSSAKESDEESTEPVESEQPAAVAEPEQASALPGTMDAAAVIALAQRLHDEHVAEGQATRDRLVQEGNTHRDEAIAEAQARHDELLTIGQTRHDELISEAESRHAQLLDEANRQSTSLVSDAEEQKASVLADLSTQRDTLQSQIDDLHTFERDYRSRLKSYIEGQLHDLESTAVEEPVSASSSSETSGS